MLSNLVPTAFEVGYRPKLLRKGNKINAILFPEGVAFRDVTKLLAPSTNLRKFGALFGLEQKKAHFPFRLLTSVETLDLRLERLPPHTDPCWKSDLSGSAPITEADVDEAQRLYEQAGCQTLGEYLQAYLWLDVEILYRATQEWRRNLKDVTGLDFVEARKFTISSLSYEAGLKRWESLLRVGCFSVNNSQMYRLLRKGMRG